MNTGAAITSLAAHALDAAARELETELFGPGEQRESETGLGAATALVDLVSLLSVAGQLRTPQQQQAALRIGREQLQADGKKVRKPGANLNRPDVSFVFGDGPNRRRMNIEIDTSGPSSKKHQQIVDRDRKAQNLYLIVDRWTGGLQSGRVRLPGQASRALSPSEVKKLSAALDAAHRRSLSPGALAPIASLLPRPARKATARAGRPAREFSL